jgi:hypothetical protein
MSLATSMIGGFIGNGADSYTVTRGSAPTFVDGVVVPGATTTVQILAAILPARNTDLRRTVEGERLTDLVVIYTGDPVFSGHDDGAPADLVEWNGHTYEIEDVDPFPGGLYQATARKRVAA